MYILEDIGFERINGERRVITMELFPRDGVQDCKYINLFGPISQQGMIARENVYRVGYSEASNFSR